MANEPMGAVTMQRLPGGALARLRDVLKLVSLFRGEAPVLTDPAGLRQALEAILKLGEIIGLDAAWLARVRSILEIDATFQLVLSLIRFVYDLLDGEEKPAEVRSQEVELLSTVEAQSVLVWLPLVIQLVGLWRQVRATRRERREDNEEK